MTKVLVDAHCHLDLFEDPTELMRESDAASIITIAVTNAPSVYFFTRDLAKTSRCVRAAIGLHPELARERRYELEIFWDALKSTRYVGEVGLDYVTNDQTDRQVQREVFSEVLSRCGAYGDKVLTVHSRKAASDVVDMIGPSFKGKAILHWFTGTKRELERAIANGCYFSVNAAMLSSANGRALTQAMPRERVITESDGPFAKVAGKPCRPTSVLLALRELASIWGVDEDEAASIVALNFKAIVE